MPSSRIITSEMDIKIGQAIRAVRIARGISQTDLGKVLGVTFQQLQKQESGKNRLSVSALVLICQKLGVSPMDIIGPLIGEPSDNAGELAKQVASLKQQLTAVRTAVREATK